MNCSECEQLLQQLLDGEIIADRTELDCHLQSCPPCRGRHAASQRLSESLRLLTPPAPPDGLAAAIVAGVLARQQATRRLRRQLVAVAALAASVLVVGIGLATLPHDLFRGDHSSKVLVLDGNSSSVQRDEVPSDTPSLNHTVAEARDAVASLTRRTADETVGQTRLLLPDAVPAPPVPGADPMASVWELPDEPLREAAQGVSAGFEPMTNSARRAIDLFMREIAPSDTEGKPGT